MKIVFEGLLPRVRLDVDPRARESSVPHDPPRSSRRHDLSPRPLPGDDDPLHQGASLALPERGRAHAHELDRLRSDNELLEESARTLTRDLVDAHAELRKQRNDVEQLSRRHTALVAKNAQLGKNLVEAKRTLVESRDTLNQRVRTTREKLLGVSQLWTGARPYFSLFRQGLLFNEIEKTDIDFSADTYLCLLPSTVPAALSLKALHGGRVVCDCVENVEVEKHSLAPSVHRITLEMLNLTAYGALMKSDKLMTVSNSVANTLGRFHRPVRVQPNYRRFEMPAVSEDIRDRFGLPHDSTVLVTSGNVVEGFEAVVDAMAQLPESVHLVAMIRLSPAEYAERIHKYVAERNLESRIHFVGFVPYDELAGLLATADLGLIVLDPENPNHSVSLPNRVFDFVTAGLPFIVSPLADIKNFVDEYGCGVVIDDVTPTSWASAILATIPRVDDLKKRVAEARRNATWESLEDGLLEYLEHPQTVTMLGFRDLSRYQRFLRTADTLSRRGVTVKAVFYSEDPQPVNIPNTEFYYFSERYGRGPALRRVPNSFAPTA